MTHGQDTCASFRAKFLNFCVEEQYLSKMTSTHNHRKLLENLRKFLAHAFPVLTLLKKFNINN